MKRKWHARPGMAAIFTVGLALSACGGAIGVTQEPSPAVPHPTLAPSSTPDLMVSPGNGITTYQDFLRPGMDQVAVGASIYDNWCITCHGDKGQGLTAAWRAEWDPKHQNCWQSKCHSANHPPGGFEIPRYVPAIIGPHALSTFRSATQIQMFLKNEMPMQEPGVLDDQAYWALTAYLLKQSGLELPSTPLGPDNGAAVVIHPG